MEYYCAIKKQWNTTICDNMDGPRRYYAKWNKSDRERQISYDFIYKWNRKNKINEQTKLNKFIDTENKVMVAIWERVRGLGGKGEGIK